MKRLTKILFAMTGVAAAFTSCSDEIEYRLPDEDTRPGIFLQISDAASLAAEGTRALESGDAAATAEKEGLLNDLWLMVFDSDGNWYKDPVDILSNVSEVKYHNTPNGSKEYELTEYFADATQNAKYHIYLVANLSTYTGITDWKTSIANEGKLKEKVVSFTDGSANYLLNHASVATSGLPMASLNSEITVTENSTSVKGQGITITPGASAKIHADLKFLCSKVRYTLLFDNTATDGISYSVFGGNSVIFDGAKATNLFAGTQTIGSDANTGNSPYTLSKVSLKSVQYPSNPTTYPTDGKDGTEDQRFTNLPARSESGTTRAWQGVVYLPANADLTKPTTVTFSGKTDAGTKLEYNLPLVPNTSTVEGAPATTALKAGEFYDIVAKVTKLEKLDLQKVTVTPWTTTQLLYALTQNVYLNVGTTSLESVKAGEEYYIDVDSSSEISWRSPQYEVDGVMTDLYYIELRGDQLMVCINADIPQSSFPNIRTGKAEDGVTDRDYKWFEIQAGGGVINKKIEVKDLGLYRYLTVTPNRFPINVNVLTSSGNYSNSDNTEFEVETNVDEFWFEIVNWASTSNKQADHIWIEAINDNGTTTVIPFNASGATNPQKLSNGSGVRKFRLRYEGLNDGLDIFGTSSTLQLRVRVDNTGFEGDDYVNSVNFYTDIEADTDRYVVHFKSKDNCLGNPPHIYVYQCLEGPEWSNTTFSQSGTTYKLAKMPISGRSKDSDSRDIAALEYSFTGKIAFRGWDYAANKTVLDKGSSGIKYITDAGFMKLEGDWNEKNNADNRYNTNMDFFANYRTAKDESGNYLCSCSDCRGSNYNPGWPGLAMQAEGDGWFKIELPGTATPGRALMIWTNKHSDGSHSQYPKGSGIRLFDYPSKEAWYYFEWDNRENKYNRWWPTKAQAEACASGGNVDDFTFSESNGWIYFTNPDNWSTVNVHYWGGSSSSSWPGKAMTRMTVDGKTVWGYQIPANTTGVIFNGGGDSNKTGDIDIDQSTNYYNKTGKAGSHLSDATTTNPDYGTTWPTGTYRLYWSGNNHTLWAWTKTGSGNVQEGSAFNANKSFPGQSGTWDASAQMAYVTVNISSPAEEIHWIYAGKTTDQYESSAKYSTSKNSLQNMGSYYKLVIKVKE